MRPRFLAPFMLTGALCAFAIGAGAQAAPSTETMKTSPAAAGLLGAQEKLAFDLLDRLGQKSGGKDNVLVSPASLALVFITLGEGADAPTRQALLDVLQLTGESDPTTGFAPLKAARAELAGDKSGMVQLADKVVIDPTAAPYPTALAGLKTLDGQVSIEDLRKPETIAKINDWVKQSTAGLIPTILDGPMEAAFVALNALHFKGQWQVKFDAKQSKPETFTDALGEPADVTMMHSGDTRRMFRKEGDFIAVDLPYAGDRYSLVIITTAKTPATLHGFADVAGWLGGEDFKSLSGELALPRFALSGRQDLMSAIDELGLAKARASATAFGGFAPGANLSAVLQSVVVKVDEEGTQAAAVTAGIGTKSVQLSPTLRMVVDKPFVFALRDRMSGLVLVAGYVAHPGKA